MPLSPLTYYNHIGIETKCKATTPKTAHYRFFIENIDNITEINEIAGDGVDRELQCQHAGGSCEFFLTCWMSNGLLQGTCGGILRGCCHRTAKSTNLGLNDVVDLTDLPKKDYGPVVNDPSE